MNRAIAAFCCAVVGLEILIGVPVAVCTGFLLMSQEVGSAVAVGPTSYSVGPTYSAPYDPYAPPKCVPPLPSPSMSLAPPLPACLPPTPMAGAPPAPWTQAPPSDERPPPRIAAIIESQAEIGSPLAGTSLDGPDSSAALVAAVEKVAAEDDEAELERPMLTPDPNKTGREARPTGETTSEPPVLDALQAAVEHLYQLAARYEADYSYTRADAVRELARDLRAELGIVRNEASHESPHDSAQPVPQLSDVPKVSLPPVPSDLPAPPPGNPYLDPAATPLPAENPAEEAGAN